VAQFAGWGLNRNAFVDTGHQWPARSDERQFAIESDEMTNTEGRAGYANYSRVATQLFHASPDTLPRQAGLLLRRGRKMDGVAPVITGQDPNPIVTPEDAPVTVAWTNLSVSDSDSAYPGDFTMTIEGGANYTVSGQTITPAPDFTGMLAVRVMVNDGTNDSAPYDVQVSVTPVNDVPLITAQSPDPITTPYGRPFELTLANVVVSDPDNVYPADFTFMILPGSDYTVAGNSITPASGFEGTLAVNVAVSDGSATSAVFPLQVSVAPDSAPVITGQATLSTSEETALTISLSDLVVSDGDDVYPAGFTLRLMPGSNYSIEGTTILPATNFSGALAVPVIVNDGVSDSAPFELQVSVVNVNDAPEITGQAALSTQENQALQVSVADLTIIDPDNDYPADFTLSIMGGENYSVAGTIITPSPGFNGVLEANVSVNDGTANSNFFPLKITVTPINDPPEITGQVALEVNEDTPLTLSLQQLVVTDPDNSFPEGFTLIVNPGTDYSINGTTVTPAPDFTGTLSVNVTVNDGVSTSEPFALQISVLPVNDAPLITGPSVLSTAEDVAKTIGLADLTVNDPDNDYPTGFVLTVFQGTRYTVQGTTVTPEPDFYGALNVQVQVSDGVLSSNLFTIKLEVTPVNDIPVITGQIPVETGEDVPVRIALDDLTVLDADNVYPSGFSLAVSPGVNYTFSGTTVTPALDFNGTLNVNVTVSDGMDNSVPFIFQIQVGDANDAPVITGQTSVATDEEHPVTIVLSNLMVTDPDTVYPTGFSLLVSPGNNYTVSGETVTPEVNFAGVLTVPVRVNDGINNSASYDFKIQVNQVNDPPFFAAIPNQEVAENTVAGSLTITGISKGPMEDDQQLTFVATSGNTSVVEDPVIVYSGRGSTATLSYAVKPNASGVVTMTVVAIDNGSNVPPNQNSYSSEFLVEVTEINSAPTLDEIKPITILEDAELQNVSLTGISAGAGETQNLTATVISSRPEFFDLLEVRYTSPDPTGLLRFKPHANVYGTAQVSVTISDNGPGTRPHVNTVTRKFDVVIQPVNDAPYFTSSPVKLAVTGEAYEYKVTAEDPDGGKVKIAVVDKPGWTSLRGEGNGAARLGGTPGASDFGDHAVKIEVSDGSVTVEQSFSLYVNARPSAASLSLVVEEDSAMRFSPAIFDGGYSDVNGNALSAVQVVTLPASGQLFLSGQQVKASDTIAVTALSALVYKPVQDYSGSDSFGWKAFDGFHLSAVPGRVDISVIAVNDAPLIAFEKDTLDYEVNGEPALLYPMLTISDVDDDSLTHATVEFEAEHYRPEMDLLQFTGTGSIRGSFSFQDGKLELTGKAPVSDYVDALRSVSYLHRNTLDPILEPKTVSVIVDDGHAESAARNKIIMLQYTFVEFSIPSGFTPNGDQANDTWVIERPGGGLEELDDAIISVYNKEGVLVFRAQGFDRPWDGTMNGELLPADSYFFTIDLRLRNKKTYKGIVTLLR
jgi:gliding motility-associated-like protein